MENNIEEKKVESVSLVINLNENIKDVDNSNLIGYDLKNNIVEMDVRLAYKWAISTLPPEEHCKFDNLSNIHKLLPMIKPDSENIVIDTPEFQAWNKWLILNCKHINSVAKDHVLSKLKAF